MAASNQSHPAAESGAIDEHFLHALAEFDDPLGFVSILVDVDRSDAGDPRPSWELTTRNALGDLADKLKDEGDQGAEAAARLADASDAVDELLDPRTSGRSRALILALGSGTRHRVISDAPLPNEVSFGTVPRLAPLAAAVSASGRAGLASVSRSGLDVFSPQAGNSGRLVSEPFDEDTDEWRKMVGPAGDSPALARHSASQRDLFSRRVEEHLIQFLVRRSDAVAALAEAEAWQALVVAGDPRLTEPVVDTLRAKLDRRGTSTSVSAIASSRHWDRDSELKDELDGALAELRRERDQALVERAHDGALADGSAVLGAADVINGLAEGRVEHLLIGRDATIRGAKSAAGQLVLAGERPPGIDRQVLGAEVDLVDDVIKRAFASGSKVTVPAGEPAALLRERGDVAALVRW
ncbi:MAG: hypothetical protein ACR2OD_07510 [Gaiellaceae bacterium]